MEMDRKLPKADDELEVSKLRQLLREQETKTKEQNERLEEQNERLEELSDVTTFQGLLDSRLSELLDLSPHRQSSTEAVGSHVPTNVISWSLREPMATFRAELLSEDQSPGLMTKAAKKMAKPGITSALQASDESQVVSHFFGDRVQSSGFSLQFKRFSNFLERIW
jgi:hypothetical protein